MCAVDVEGDVEVVWDEDGFGFGRVGGRSDEERCVVVEDSTGLLGDGTW